MRLTITVTTPGAESTSCGLPSPTPDRRPLMQTSAARVTIAAFDAASAKSHSRKSLTFFLGAIPIFLSRSGKRDPVPAGVATLLARALGTATVQRISKGRAVSLRGAQQ